MFIGNKQAEQVDWQKNDDDVVEGSARQGVELGVEETETGRKERKPKKRGDTGPTLQLQVETVYVAKAAQGHAA